MQIDINKKYRYREGGLARVLCVDRPRGMPVVSMTEQGEIAFHSSDGSYLGSATPFSLDLIEIREPREFRVGVHIRTGNAYLMPDNADNLAYEFIRVREVID